MYSLIYVLDNNNFLKFVKDNGKLNVDGILVCFGYIIYDCFVVCDNV